MANQSVAQNDLQIYLQQIHQTPLLAAEEERDLGKKIAAGKEAAASLESEAALPVYQRQRLAEQVRTGDLARDRLIRANTRLVVKTAYHLMGRGLPLEDLIQEGNIGLMKAADRFDYRLGNRFSTYAVDWIHYAMRQAIFEQGRNIRLPANIRIQLRLLLQTETALLGELRRHPTTAELSCRLGWTSEQIKKLREWLPDTESLDKPLIDDGDRVPADYLADDKVESPMEAISRHVVRDLLYDQLEGLPGEENEILCLRYGLRGRAHSLDETARRLGLSVHQVRTLERRALGHMRTGRLRHAVLVVEQ